MRSGHPFGKSLWGGAAALVAAFLVAPAVYAQHTSEPKAAAGVEHTHWLCDVAYTPTRSSWRREVRLSYDSERLQSVEIDGVRVYTFSAAGTLLLTSLDNERIRIDVGTRTWSSDFRGLAEGQGRCEPVSQ